MDKTPTPNVKLWPILDVLGRNKNIDDFVKERLYEAIRDVTVDECRTACNENMKNFYKKMYEKDGDDPVEAGKTGDRIASARLSVILTEKGSRDTIKPEVAPISESKMKDYLSKV